MKPLHVVIVAALVAAIVACLVPQVAQTEKSNHTEPIRSRRTATLPSKEVKADREAADRKEEWAKPLNKPGLPNLHKVSDDLYRGAQPTAQGMKQLKQMGVKTVINLRSFHSDRDKIGETGLAYEHMYVKAWHPEDKEVVRFLQIVTDPDRIPAFVHCQHGADRTGTMCAIYRIVVEDWSREEAIEEMIEGGFGYHKIHANLPKYIRRLDLDDIVKRAGITERLRKEHQK